MKRTEIIYYHTNVSKPSSFLCGSADTVLCSVLTLQWLHDSLARHRQHRKRCLLMTVVIQWHYDAYISTFDKPSKSSAVRSADHTHMPHI